jgi:hypothetical protein
MFRRGKNMINSHLRASKYKEWVVCATDFANWSLSMFSLVKMFSQKLNAFPSAMFAAATSTNKKIGDMFPT